MVKAFSSEIKTSFTLTISLFELRRLLLKKDLIVFQKILLHVKSIYIQFLKVVFLGIARKLYTEVPLFFVVFPVFLCSCFMKKNNDFDRLTLKCGVPHWDTLFYWCTY